MFFVLSVSLRFHPVNSSLCSCAPRSFLCSPSPRSLLCSLASLFSCFTFLLLHFSLASLFSCFTFLLLPLFSLLELHTTLGICLAKSCMECLCIAAQLSLHLANNSLSVIRVACADASWLFDLYLSTLYNSNVRLQCVNCTLSL